MTDFNQDDRITPPVVPPQDQTRRKRLSSDELIALFVAFTSIGGILFWTLSQRTSPLSLGSLTSGTPSLSNGNGASTVPTPSSEGVQFNGTSSGKASSVSDTNLKPSDSTSTSSNQGSAPTPHQAATDPQANSKTNSQTNPPTQSDQASSIAPTLSPTLSPTMTAAAGGAAGAIANSAKPSSSPANSDKGTLTSPIPAKPFSDVPNDFWAKDAIAALSSRGVINGFSDNTFKPEQPINRAEFAGIVQKAFEKPKTKDVKKFTDIKEGFWGASAIDEATQTGFMNGYPGGVFKPEQVIPRLEMLSAIATGMNLKPQGDPTQTLARYRDAKDLPNWAVPKVSSAIDAGISVPNSTLLEPTKPATRADAAAFIYQALIKDGKIKP
jgi:S-layer homology domain